MISPGLCADAPPSCAHFLALEHGQLGLAEEKMVTDSSPSPWRLLPPLTPHPPLPPPPPRRAKPIGLWTQLRQAPPVRDGQAPALFCSLIALQIKLEEQYLVRLRSRRDQGSSWEMRTRALCVSSECCTNSGGLGNDGVLETQAPPAGEQAEGEGAGA